MIIIQNNEIMKFSELEEDERFIYQDGDHEFYAIKINENYAAFINADARFILAKKYTNCLSIGAAAVREFDSYKEVVEYAETKPIL